MEKIDRDIQRYGPLEEEGWRLLTFEKLDEIVEWINAIEARQREFLETFKADREEQEARLKAHKIF